MVTKKQVLALCDIEGAIWNLWKRLKSPEECKKITDKKLEIIYNEANEKNKFDRAKNYLDISKALMKMVERVLTKIREDIK